MGATIALNSCTYRAFRRIGRLSGWGAGARAIVNRPAILFADERTGNLDSKTSLEMMGLFRSLNEGGQTVVMVTHNPGNCDYSDRTIHLRDGRVAAFA